ncbi:MAG: alanine--tRNA ligase [Elusimicrobiota bacterium]
MKDKVIRKKFKKYFQDKGHRWYDSMSLIPPDDPTMLFTTAGMVQFKKQFLGEVQNSRRAASIQKCLRTSDIDEVGKTSRHLTFFEMYGNFSFGDYFKKEAIQMAWEFLTDVLGLEEEKLYATVYKDDDKAFSLWEDYMPPEKIYRLGEEDNFWEMGKTGPCGPCSEILYDRGPGTGCGDEGCEVGCDCDRYVEVWNLVFTQYEKLEDGSLKDLPQKNIDTGMGLERLNQVVNGRDNVYEIELIKPVIDKIKRESGEFNIRSARIVADHIRAATFLIADGVAPSNEGPGYILRRLIRRASREGRKLGWEEPGLWKFISLIIDIMADYYPVLLKRAEHITRVCKLEEQNFFTTLKRSLKLLENEIQKLKQTGQNMMDGETAFKLYDTYGLPIDITKDILRDRNLKVDEQKFNEIMEKRSQKSSWKDSDDRAGSDWPGVSKIKEETEFNGYNNYSHQARVVKILKDGAGAVLSGTPMYPEAGGQVGDSGIIKGENGKFRVENTIKENGVIIHKGELTGSLQPGDKVTVKVDYEKRKAAERNHTATHLLQSALRKALGTHIQQNGSYVGPDRLRFDFTHPDALSRDEIQVIENKVNSKVLENIPVDTKIKDKKEAEKEGALAFFKEKYSGKVRVVRVGTEDQNVSTELCGGTHLKNTGEIGLFKIVSESGVAAGVRRIEAVTGKKALEYVESREKLVDRISEELKTPQDKLIKGVKNLKGEIKELKDKISALENKLLSNDSGEEKENLNGIDFYYKDFGVSGTGVMRSWGDEITADDNCVAFAVSESDGKAVIILKISKNLTEHLHAGNLVSKICNELNGGGGGREDMGQGGGPAIEKLDLAVNNLKNIIEKKLENKNI